MGPDSSSKTGTGRRPPVADEAAEWLAILSDPACLESERQRFVTWMRRSNLHVEEFLLVSALTRRLTGAGALPRVDVEELVQRAKADLAGNAPVTDISAHPAASIRAVRSSRKVWALAACVPLVIALSFALARFGLTGWLAPVYTTSLGELRSITLEDGSVVELNTRSRLRTRFTPSERRVELLRGEAVFKVARNPARPFRVVAGSAEIVAVGTAFNVYAQRSRTVVTVLEGRVRVMREQSAGPQAPAPLQAQQELELARGEQAIVAPRSPLAKATLTDPRQVTAWTERRLVFDETPLADAASEFARYSARLIQIKDPALGELHITGVFDATDPASLVQFVQAYSKVEVREDAGGWTLDGKAVSASSP